MKKILLFLLTFLACTYSAQADMKLACPASDWGNSTWVFTDNQDGTWTYTIDDASTISKSDFKILVDGNWYGLTGSTFNVGDTKTLYKNDGGNAKFGTLSGKVTLKLTNKVDGDNPNITLTITAEGSTPTPTYTDLYIVYKNGDGWDALDENLKFTTEDGTNYVLNDVAITAGATFAIGNKDLKFGIDNAEMTPANTLADAVSRTGWSDNTKYGKWASTIERNVNIVATLGAQQGWGRQIDFKVYYVEGTTPDPVTYPENIYYYYSSSSEMLKIAAKDQANGVYEATLTIAENASFRFYSNSNKADDFAYGPTNTSANVAISLGEKVEMKNTSTKRWELTNTAGEYTFTVDLKNKTFTVVAKSAHTEFWLVGEETKDGETAWSFIDAFKFETTDGVTYTLKNVSVTAGKQFKISDKTHYMGYGKSDDQMEIAAGKEGGYNIYDGDNNLKWHSSVACNVNITYTKLSETSGNIYVEYVYPDLWLRGDFTSTKWGVDDQYKFTCTDGVYTLTVEAGKLSNCEFKIGSSETSGAWTIGFGGKDANVTAKIGEAFTVNDVDGGKNIYIAENSYKFDIKFVPDFANNTGELTISINNPSGIEDVEISNEAPVEFYNLQGVRVDGELTPGLYIRRQGNSASKVLIR